MIIPCVGSCAQLLESGFSFQPFLAIYVGSTKTSMYIILLAGI